MRVFLKLSILLASYLLVAAGEDTRDEENSWKTGMACTTCACQQRSAHFDKESFCMFSYFPSRAYKMLWFSTPTNFVVYIRNIESNTHGNYYMTICDELKCQYLSSTEDQVFLFTATKKVIMYIDMSTSFEVQYYVGCDVLDQTDVVVGREAGSLFPQPGYCWIVIPRLYNKATTQHTAATNIFLSHVNVPENSRLSLKNVLTGELLLDFKNYTNFDVTSLDKSESAITYQTNKYISSMFLFTVVKCPPDACTDISFQLKVQALSHDDSECFRRKQACVYGLPEEYDEEQVSCGDEDEEETCDAFEKFEEEISFSGPQPLADGSRNNKSRRSRCKWHYRNKEKKYFCRKDKNNKTKFSPDCSKFGVCALYCIERRVFRKICGKSLRIFD